MIVRYVVVAALLILSACGTAHQQREGRATLARGEALAEAHCATCHAVGRSGESATPEAPPFRTLSRHYRVDTLEEALAQGISVGHPAMPEFQFEPDDVHSLVLYLQSIQDDRGDHSPTP